MKSTGQIFKRVWKYCETHGMLEPGDRILTGVSGGADSVCLLFLLHKMRERLQLNLRVVHVHHGIRKEADEDAAYVKALCEKLEIPFMQVSVDVPALARREGISEEEAGRKARYEAFEKYAATWQEETGANIKIALAHHAGDRAETLLFNLFRGSGLKGLASIPPVRKTAAAGVMVIRPILCLERAEIEDYLKENDITYCQDATNLEDTYARNRIRHHILPYAEREICSGARQHLNQAAELFAETEAYLQAQTTAARATCVETKATAARATCVETKAGAARAMYAELSPATENTAYFVNVLEFERLPSILQKRLLLELLLELSPCGKDVGVTHVEAVRDLFFGESGRSADLPFGMTARREYDKVILERSIGKDLSDKDEKEIFHGTQSESDEIRREIDLTKLSENEACDVPWGNGIFTFQRISYEKKEIIPEKAYTKWFDCDKIKNTLSIRTRKPGDFLMIRSGDGRPVKKTLKTYFITEKFPRRDRESLPLLAEGSHVLWIAGHRISETYKVDEGTKTVLQVEWKINGGERDG